MEVLGASSDHTILDVEDAAVPVRLGDVLDFGVSYGSLVYLTNTPEVRIVYRKGGRPVHGGITHKEALRSVSGGLFVAFSFSQLSVVPVTKLATMMSRMEIGATYLTSTL